MPDSSGSGLPEGFVFRVRKVRFKALDEEASRPATAFSSDEGVAPIGQPNPDEGTLQLTLMMAEGPCVTRCNRSRNTRPQSATNGHQVENRPHFTGVGCGLLRVCEASGACGRKVVEVQILSSAPINFSGEISTDREALANQTGGV